MTYDQHHGFAGSGPRSLPVSFEFTGPAAVSVYIAGTFHNGQPGAKPLHPAGNSRWIRELVLPVGTHGYCLVAVGKFRADPRAKRNLPCQSGGVNSILRVTNRGTIRFVPDAFQKNWRST